MFNLYNQWRRLGGLRGSCLWGLMRSEAIMLGNCERVCYTGESCAGAGIDVLGTEV